MNKAQMEIANQIADWHIECIIDQKWEILYAVFLFAAWGTAGALM